MPPARAKGHTTLSDLLADDVRDYFLREGVSESPLSAGRPRSENDNGRRSGRAGRGGAGAAAANADRSQSAREFSYSSKATAAGGSLQTGWSANNAPASGAKYGQNGQQQHQHQQQESKQQLDAQGNALGLPHRRHSSDSLSFRQQDNNFPPQTHRRHASGSGSLHSMSSAGSMRSRTVSAADAEFLRRYAEEKERTNERMSAARPNWGLNQITEAVAPRDAVPAASFSRSRDGDCSHGCGGKGGDCSKKDDFDSSRPYKSLVASPRPPTVTGSHRPGLPSIDGDDWEEDDRIERRDKRKSEKREKRRLERRLRGSSSHSVGSGEGNGDGQARTSGSRSLDGNPSASYGRGMGSSTDSNFGSGFTSKASWNGFGGNGNPGALHGNSGKDAGVGTITPGGAAHDEWHRTPAVGHITPGSERYESGSSILCYSTGSSQLHGGTIPSPANPPSVMPFHGREDSMGTFVRMSSVSSHLNEGTGTGEGDVRQRQEQERHPRQETKDDVDGSGPKKTHVRPLSYLSASSDSGKSGEPSIKENMDDDGNVRNGENSASSARPIGRLQTTSSGYSTLTSPHSSSSGTFRHPFQSAEITRLSSNDTASLMGSSLLDSSVPSSGEIRFARVNHMGMNNGIGGPAMDRDYHQHHQLRPPPSFEGDGESSEGSYDSEDESSDDSSYTSGSYYGDTSSHTSSERRPTNKRSNGNSVGWQPVNFSLAKKKHQDIERGGAMSHERDRLTISRNGGGANYSTMETTMTNKSRKPKNKTKYEVNDKGHISAPSHNRRQLRGGPNSALPLRLDDAIDVLLEKMNHVLVLMELYISNMPSLVGSLALCWASLGVDWFKWYEETFDACVPASFHSKDCVFPEFPGCFACDTDRDSYQFVLLFHYLCSTIAFILSSFLVAKIIIAFPVVRDELANPTTAAPLGLLCMALEKVFSGNFGYIGESIAFAVSGLHTLVFGWFLFISIVYKTLPEPSWFSNTTGIGLAAAKVWTYWTPGGYFLEGLALLAFAMFYVVSLYRIHTNEKISLPVCWVQLSAPAVVLYGATIYGQPGSDEDVDALLIEENKEHFNLIHRRFYMPLMHTLFAFSLISMVSSLYLLWVKWKSFREKVFSPAHVSFAAPLISHANGLQAYRSSFLKFSLTPPGTPFKLWLYRYWMLCLVSGTILTLVMTYKFFIHLSSWTKIDVEDDEMPPDPEETVITQLLQKGEARDEMKQNFVSAAVLQANESGALVRVVQDGKMKYVRSRRMPSIGFDPIMNVSELMSERERLLQHVTYSADPSIDRGGMSSFDDVIRWDSFRERDQLRQPSGRRRLSFLSFDASTMMRGDRLSFS